MSNSGTDILDSDLAEEEYNVQALKAEWYVRVVHWIIDQVVAATTMILTFMISIVIILAAEMDTDQDSTLLFAFICLMGGYFTYYFLAEHFFGKTVGKIFTSTRVVHISGQRPSGKNILIRSLLRYFPFSVVGYLSMRAVPFHDNWSNTLVVFDYKGVRRQKRLRQFARMQETNLKRQELLANRYRARHEQTVAQFKKKYADYSTAQLEEINGREDLYTTEALKAARALLEERTKPENP